MTRGGFFSALEHARAKVVVKSPLALSLGISTGADLTSAAGSVPSGHSRLIGAHGQSRRLLFCVLDHVDHDNAYLFR